MIIKIILFIKKLIYKEKILFAELIYTQSLDVYTKNF